MKNYKFVVRRFASLTLAAMCSVLFCVSAFATDGVGESGTITVKKTLTGSENVMVPNETFTFTVVPEAPTTGETRNDIPVTIGPGNSITSSATVTFTPQNADTSYNVFAADNDLTFTEECTFTVDLAKFSSAGVYKYKMTETEGSREGITYDTADRFLYVYIENTDDGSLKVAYTELVKSTDNGEVKTDTFANTYGSLKTLVVAKDITGALADKKAAFTFDVTVSGTAGEMYYAVSGTMDGEGNFTADSNPTILHLTSGTAQTITLGDDAAYKIYGLSSSDTYSVKETDDKIESDSYEVSATLNGEDKTLTDEYEIEAETLPENVTDNVVIFTNNREGVSPTGLILNAAPYVAMIALAAAAGGILVVRRRREDR